MRGALRFLCLRTGKLALFLLLGTIACLLLEFLVLTPWPLAGTLFALLCAGLVLVFSRHRKRGWRLACSLTSLVFLVWFGVLPWATRAVLLNLAGQVRVQMTRAEVELLFESMGPFQFRTDLDRAWSQADSRSHYSHPSRSMMQDFEHITVYFDDRGRVVRHEVTLDP